MNLDIFLLLASVGLTALLAAEGIEMANKPPTTDKARWTYRVVFAVLGLLLLGTTYWQVKRNTAEQARINKEADEQKKVADARYNQLQGKLENITQFVSHPPAGFTQDQVTAVVHSLTKNSSKPAPPPQTTVINQPAYGNVAARCQQLGQAIVATANWRMQNQPNPAVDRQNYNTWYMQNDGVYFHGPFYREVAKLHKELADLHIDDSKLDELIKRHEDNFRERQLHVQGAIDHPMMYHCSIEEIKELGERFIALAAQIPH